MEAFAFTANDLNAFILQRLPYSYSLVSSSADNVFATIHQSELSLQHFIFMASQTMHVISILPIEKPDQVVIGATHASHYQVTFGVPFHEVDIQVLGKVFYRAFQSHIVLYIPYS